MKIFFVPAHEPVDSELIDRWINLGHQVILPTNSPLPWNEMMAKIPEGTLVNSKEKPDIIFCEAHSRNVIYTLIHKFRNLWFDVPTIFYHLWFPDRRVLPFYYLADAHMTSCQMGADYLKNVSGLNSKIVYLPVDTELFTQNKTFKNRKIATIIGKNFKERSGSGKSRNIMGTDLLFKIFNLTHDIDPEIKFIVNGYNPGLDVPKFVEKKFFPGDYKKGLYDVISISSCVFFTTTWNMIPHSLTNAMSAEKNTVVWDLPAYHEIIQNGKSGFLIKPYDVEAFAQKIVEVCNNPSRGIGKMARKSIVQTFERNKSAKQYIDFFKTIVE